MKNKKVFFFFFFKNSNKSKTQKTTKTVFTESSGSPTDEDEGEKKNAGKMSSFLNLFNNFNKVWIEKINTSLEEAKIQKEKMEEVAAREKKAAADIKRLNRDLNNEQTQRKKDFSAQADILKKLNEDFETNNSKAISEKDQFDKEFGERQENLKKFFDNTDKEKKTVIESQSNKLKDLKRLLLFFSSLPNSRSFDITHYFSSTTSVFS